MRKCLVKEKIKKVLYEKKINQKRMRGLLCLLLILLLYFCMSFLPYFMEYFVVNPDIDIAEYLLLRYWDADSHGYTHFENCVVFMLIIIMYCFSFKFSFAFVTVSILGGLLALISHLKYVNRIEMMNYSDLKLTEAAGMAMNYVDINFNHCYLYFMGFILGIVFSSMVLDWLLKETVYNIGRKRYIKYIRGFIGIVISVVLLTFCNQFMNKDSLRDSQDRYLYFAEHNDMHVIFQFLQRTQFNTSPEEIERDYRELTNQLIAESVNEVRGMEELPTIIVIMNESWWNLDNIPKDKVSYSIDPMQPLWELDERCDLGCVGVNIYGGGTVSSEAEFLMGLNTKFFSTTSDVYLKLKDRDFPSIVRYFDNMGYKTTSIHPYYDEFYNRETIYKTMGFDESIFEDDMFYNDKFDKFVCDKALMKQIIYEEEKENENPDFIFATSIASHGWKLEYDHEALTDYEYSVDVKLADDVQMAEDDYNNFVHHVNGIYEANIAFTELINYYEMQERPVMIVMYGDHCPNLSTTTLASLGVQIQKTDKWVYETENEEVKQKLYSTPVVVWNNFSDEPFVIEGENINALADKIIDYAELPETRMTLINKHYRQTMKANTRHYMTAPDGTVVDELSEEQSEGIETLMMIHYDILEGDLVCCDIWNPIGVDCQEEYVASVKKDMQN